MIENNLLTIVGSKIIEYPDEIGARHLDKLKQTCHDLNLSIDKNNEVEIAIDIASNNNIVIMNSYGALLIFMPEILSEIQVDFILSNKDKFYQIENDDGIIEIAITTDKIQDYNRKKYRELGIEKQIASYENRKVDSQLDILYNELEHKKTNMR